MNPKYRLVWDLLMERADRYDLRIGPTSLSEAQKAEISSQIHEAVVRFYEQMDRERATQARDQLVRAVQTIQNQLPDKIAQQIQAMNQGNPEAAAYLANILVQNFDLSGLDRQHFNWASTVGQDLAQYLRSLPGAPQTPAQAAAQGAQQAAEQPQEPSQASEPVDMTQYPPENLASFQGHANDARLSPGGVIELTPGAHQTLSQVKNYLKKPFSYRNPGTTPVVQKNFFGWAGKTGSDASGRPAGWAGIIQLTNLNEQTLPGYLAWAERDPEGFIRKVLAKSNIDRGSEVLIPTLAKLFKQWAQQYQAAAQARS